MGKCLGKIGRNGRNGIGFDLCVVFQVEGSNLGAPLACLRSYLRSPSPISVPTRVQGMRNRGVPPRGTPWFARHNMPCTSKPLGKDYS